MVLKKKFLQLKEFGNTVEGKQVLNIQLFRFKEENVGDYVATLNICDEIPAFNEWLNWKKNHRMKKSPKYIELAKKGKVQKKTLVHLVFFYQKSLILRQTADNKTAANQYIRFLREFDPEIRLSMNIFWNDFYLEKFTTFCEEYDWCTSTQINKIKYLTEVFFRFGFSDFYKGTEMDVTKTSIY